MVAIVTPSDINWPYNWQELSREINLIPKEWGRLRELGLFAAQGISTTMVEIAFTAGKVRVLAAVPRGTEGSRGTQDPENSVILKIPHFNHTETLAPEDLQDRLVFGSGRKQLRKLDVETVKKLAIIRRNILQTREFVCMGALKGLIIDGKGASIYNLFTVFGVEQKVVDFALGTEGTDVMAKCHEVVDHIEDNLKGDTATGVRCLVDQGFFDKLTQHPGVEKYFLQHTGAVALEAARQARRFSFGGIDFEVYRAKVTGVDGVNRKFIATGEGHAYPEGTEETFDLYDGPPHHITQVNTEGMEMFVTDKVLDHGRGVELLGQANMLPVCNQPAVLVKVYSSN